MSFLLWLLTAGLCALLVVADRSPSDHGSEPIFFNVASKANVTATSTCGEGKKPTTWCPFTFTGNNLGFGCDECDAKKPDKRHPISFAVDGHKTWWQSEIYPGEVNVTVDLRQQFHVSSVVLKIGPSLPPRNWILEKSEDGVSFTPWQYFAGTVKECLELFGKRTNGKPKFIEDTICVTIKSKLQNMDFGEIAVNLLAFRPDADNFTFSERLQKWTKASHVRLRLLQPHTLEGHYYLSAHHDDSFKRLIFYSLRDITILARCICHGHSNTCEWNSTVHRFECRCLHNTCGEECKRCCDGFVQFPWKPGHVNVNFTCEPCNCFGHSHDCVYNVTVDMKNLSLDTAGRKRGGGVCLNCQNNTTGINCEQCAPGYFRPEKLPLTSACEDCQCHGRGVNVRECDSTGQCPCRPKIQGKKCDRCLPGHWGLPHCSRCHCSPIGSLNTSCHEKTGQCSCKKNVIGKNCDQCYNNMILTINGCLACNCFGHSHDCVYNVKVSLDTAGRKRGRVVCLNCQNNTFGLNCEQCAPGYFRPEKLPLTSACEACNCFGHSHDCAYNVAVDMKNLILDAAGRKQGGVVCLNCQNNTFGLNCEQCAPGYFRPEKLPLTSACEDCQCHVQGVNVRECDSTGQCRCPPKIQGKKCDRCLPGHWGFPHCSRCHCSPIGSLYMSCHEKTGQCSCKENVIGKNCDQCYNNMILTINGCLACNCFGHSHDCVYNVAVDMKNLSLDTAGRKRGGVVCLNCQNNTFGINCEQCAPGYFRPKKLPLTSACEDCQCHVQGVNVRECDSTGQCRCRPKIQGKKCDRCLPGHWGFPHCSRCHCSPIGSLNTSCHEKTGQCSCKKNVIGKNCDQCYKNMILTISGCLACNCFGHSHDCVYNVTVDMKNLSLDTAGRKRGGGVCLNCQNNTIGINCEQCAPGYFRPKILPLTSACEDCQCHVHGVYVRECDSTGQCRCRAKIQGKKCDRCLPGHWGFPHCSRCHCSPIGSLYMSCHEKTGQCSCKKNVIGKNCDQCYKNMILTINGCLDCDNCSLILKKEVRIYERAVGVWLHNVNHLGKTPTQRLQRSYLTHIEHRVQELHEQMKYHSLGNVEIIISSYLSYPVDGTLHSSVTILENALRSNMKATATAFRNSTNLANEAEYTLSLARLRYNGTGLFQAWRETKDLVDYVLEMAFAFNAKSKPKENEDNSIHAGAKLLVDIKKVDFCAPKRKAEQEVVAAEELYRVFNGTCHRISSNLYSCMPENYKSRLQQVTKSTAELHLLSRNILQNKTKIQNLNWDNKAAIKLIKGRIDDRKQYEHQFQIVKHLVSSSANLLQDAEQDWLAIIRHKKPLLEKTSRLHDTLRFLKNLPSEIKKSKYNSWKLHRQFTRLTETLDSTLRRTKKFMNTTTSRHFLKEANETALEILQAVQFWSFNVSKTLTRSKALEEWARFLLKLTQSATRVHLKSTVILDKDTNGEELEGSASGEGAVEDHMYIGEQGDEPLHSSEKLRQHPLGSPALESSNRSIQDPQVPNDMGDFWMDEQPLTHYALDQLRDMITNIREVNYGYLEEGLKCKTSAQNILTNLTTSVKLSNGIQSSLQIKNEFINTLKSFSSDHVKALPDYAIVQRNTWPTLKESFVKINERVHQLENRGKSLTKDICGDYQNCSLELFQQAASKTMDFVNIAAKCKKSSVHLAVARPHMTMFEQVNKKIASLREKIALAKKIARTIKGPVKFFSPGFTSPSLPEEISKPSAISRIEIAFHSEYEDGLIFSTSNATEAFQVFVTLTQSRVVVCATLNGERQCTVLSAYIPLMKWIHLSLIRIGNEFAVSLSAEGSVSSERTMIWESAVNVIVPLSFPVYVGGIPEEIKILKQNDFDGCLALTLNEHTVSLMTSDVQLGIQEFCTDSYARSYNKETIVSFNGKGYHKMTPNIMLTPMNLSFSFRTFEDRSLLLHVQGVKKTDYLSVWVEEGNILVVYRERSASMKLSTQLHNYHDGNWHEIQIKQEKNTWSLSVDNMDRDSSVFLYFVTQLPSHCVLLGGLDSYTQQLLPSWIHTLKNLTGCLSNITFQGNVLNVQDFESSRASRIGACQMPNSKCACLSSEQMSLRPLPSVVVHFVSFSFRTSASRSSLMMYRTSMHSLIHVYHENGRVNVHVRSRHLSGRYLDREDKVTANDGQWHTVLLLRNHNHSSTLMVDEFRMQFPDRLTESIYESQHFLYLGGPLNSESTGVCFKDVALNNRLMELASKHHISCNDRINKVTHQEDEIRLRKNELLK